ncbi:unnamed protein product [Alopecurus aequalis]
MRRLRTRDCSPRRSAATSVPYCRKGRRMKKGRRHIKVGGMTASLSDDTLAVIFDGLSDLAALVRCAATCHRWGRVVATTAAALSRSLPPLGRFSPHLAVGVFHLEKELPTTPSRYITRSRYDVRPSFVAMGSATRFLGGGQPLLGLGDGGLLEYSRPVASRNGRLVLELRREGRAMDGLRLAVCNLMTRDDIVVLPPLIISDSFLAGNNSTAIRDYGCTLLTEHDLRPPRCHSFFRLLLVYNHNSDGSGDSTLLLRKGSMREEEAVLMHQMNVPRQHTGIKLRWFGEKSGVVLFTLGERSRHTGTYVLNLQEEVVTKVDDHSDSWENLVGYEMDTAAYLASIAKQL